MKRIWLGLAAGLFASVVLAVTPGNVFTLRHPMTDVKLTTGSVRFYAQGKDSSVTANQLHTAYNATNQTWTAATTMANGDSIRAGFYDAAWSVGPARTVIASGNTAYWINGTKAPSSYIDAPALRSGVIAWGNLASAVQDSIGAATIGPGSITSDMLAPECFTADKIADANVTWEKLDLAVVDSIHAGGSGGGGDIYGVGTGNKWLAVTDSTTGVPKLRLNVVNPPSGADTFLVANAAGLAFRSAPAGEGGGSDYTFDVYRTKPFLFADFLNGQSGTNIALPGWTGTAISGGLTSYASATAQHPGVINLRSGTSANSGYVFYTNTSSYALAGGECFEAVFYVYTTTGTTVRMGFVNSVSISTPVNAVYLRIVGTTLEGVASTDSSPSTTSSFYVVAPSTWYRGRLVINADATRADFYIYSMAGAQLWTDNVTSNIPVGGGRVMGCVVTSFNSGTTSEYLLYLDYIAQWYNTALAR